jgi:putative restriction endonuclease
MGEATNTVANGLLLRADLHTLFDMVLIWFSDTLEVQVSDLIEDAEYRKLTGRKLTLPQDSMNQPSIEAIQWHRENVSSK